VEVSGPIGPAPGESEAIRQAGSDPELSAALDLIAEAFVRRLGDEDEGGQRGQG
jgi:hypothetical protein